MNKIEALRYLWKKLRQRISVKIRRGPRNIDTTPPPRQMPGAESPLLSVVIPVYNVEDYLEQCLLSVCGQTHKNLQVIVVDDCSPDRSVEIAKRVAAGDSRVEIIRLQRNVGLSDARNAGIAVAKGDYLAFLDSDDVVRADAYESALSSLQETGSDFAVLGYWRFNSSRRWPAAPWIKSLHSTDRIACEPRLVPAVLANAVAWSKVYRRDFWERASLRFPSGRKYEDQPVSARAYGTAHSVDILEGALIGWRAREDGTSISQQIHTVEDLQARLDAAQDSLEICAELGRPELQHERQAQLLVHDFPHSVAAVPRSSQEFFDVLYATLRDLLASADEGLWDRMSPQVRIAYELLIRNDRSLLVEFFESGGGNLKNFQSKVERDEVYSLLPFYDDSRVGIERRRFRLLDRQLELQTSVRRVRRNVIEQTIEIEGWAYFDNVDSFDCPYSIDVYAQNRTTGERVDFIVSCGGNTEVSEISKHKWCNYEAATFKAVLDASIFSSFRDTQIWDIYVEAKAGFLRSVKPLKGLTKWGSAGMLGSMDLADGRVLVRRSTHGGLEMMVYRPFCTVSDAVIEGRRIRLFLDTQPTAKYVEIRNRATGVSLRASIDHDGTRPTASFEVPDVEEKHVVNSKFRRDEWLVRVGRVSGSKKSPIAWTLRKDVHGDGLRTGKTKAGNLQLVESGTKLSLSNVNVNPDQRELEFAFAAEGAAPGRVTAALKGIRAQKEATNWLGTSEFSITLRLEASLFGLPELPLPVGLYKFWVYADGHEILPEPDDGFLGRLPMEVCLHGIRGRLDINPEGQICLDVRPPLEPNERGARNQRELQEAHARQDEEVVEGSVLLRSYYGENTACNAGELGKALVRSGRKEGIYFAVRDFSVHVPHGCTPVVHESRMWYKLLRTSEVIVDNMHQPMYHSKRSGQKIIQTFHGYPYKEMGHPHWNRLGFTQKRIDSFDDRAAEWDFLVSPATYATPLLRRDFRYDGEILEIGYPRNDVLFGRHAEDRRTEVRQNLGIQKEQMVVLYAPTFRDYMSADDTSAPMVSFLDLDQVASELGRKTTILVRGHAFNARSRTNGAVTKTDQILHVTHYPDVADLYLAADVLIGDYSSLRFDFAITGKPMLFFVPDIERYKMSREGLLPFEMTAPGPLLMDTDGVIAALSNLAEVTVDYKAAYARFKEAFLDIDDGHATERLIRAAFAEKSPNYQFSARGNCDATLLSGS